MDYDLDLEWAETAHPLKLYRKMDTAEDEWPEWEFEAIVDWLGPIEGADMEIVGNVMGALQVLLFRPYRFWGGVGSFRKLHPCLQWEYSSLRIRAAPLTR